MSRRGLLLTQGSEADRPQATPDVGGVHERQDRVHQQRHEGRQSQGGDVPVRVCVFWSKSGGGSDGRTFPGPQHDRSAVRTSHKYIS